MGEWQLRGYQSLLPQAVLTVEQKPAPADICPKYEFQIHVHLFVFSETPLMLWTGLCLCFGRMAIRAETVELLSDCGRSSTGDGSPLWEGILARPSRSLESVPAPTPSSSSRGQVSWQVVNSFSSPLQKRIRKEGKVADSNTTVSSNNKKPQQCVHRQAKQHVQTHTEHTTVCRV